MHLKNFRAASLSAALAQVRNEFGPDALVLSSRRVRRDGGWFGGLGRSVFEVVAAIDRERVPNAVVRKAEARVEPDASWRSLSLSKALVDPLHVELRELRGAFERVRFAREADASLRSEVRELRHAITRLTRPPGVGGCGSDEEAFCATLQSQGIAEEHAASIAAEAVLREPGTGALLEVLVERLDARLAVPRPEDESACLIVGAAGVGKTTTTAKLATRGVSPSAVVTTDTLRLGGETQLRSWAERLELPFAAAVDAQDLALRVRGFRRGPVLVDTAGRSRHDVGALPELERLRDALDPGTRVHLVVSATTQESDLRSEIQRYRSLRPDALVVAKADECTHFANVANVLLDPDTPPLAWLGTGQGVPGDLELADPERLAARVMGVEMEIEPARGVRA